MAKTRVGIRNGALFNQTSTLWNDLVAYYTGDNTPNDSVSSNHASLFNGTTYGDGVINKGFQFDGINDYVDLPTNTFKPNGDFTVSCWLKDITSTSGWFIQVGDWTIETGFVLYLNGGVMRFTFGTNPGYYITTGPSLKSGLNHYVFNYTNGETKIYENGVLFTTGNPSPSQIPVYPQECPVRFGSRSNNLSNLLQGTLDEVGFWDRVLSESEATELYNSGAGKQYPN